MFLKIGPNLAPVPRQELTFRDLGEKLHNAAFKESHLEEFVRSNIELFLGDETLLIIGQQVINKENGRNDLVGVDGDGKLVLIELKRDAADIAHRKEPMEFQAIRYVANLASISSVEDAVSFLFGPYIRRHRNEPSFAAQPRDLTEEELARRQLTAFLEQNSGLASFNREQRIVLIAASFDEQTISACAWLAKNNVGIQCIEVRPYQIDSDYFLEIVRLIPPTDLDEFIVGIKAPGAVKSKENGNKITRKTLPRMEDLFEWHLVSPGDVLAIRGVDGKDATVKDQGSIEFNGEIIGYNDWGQRVTGWSSINIYEWAISKRLGKTLDQLRRERMTQLDQQAN
jgi:hypothetical protein